MGHHVSGLIANAEALARIAVEHGLPAPTQLDFADFAFLPLDEDDLDALPGVTFAEMADDRFRFLSPSLIDWIGRCSIGGDICYVETDYFGGNGGQGALRVRDGALVYGPAWGDVGTINAALAGMGVPDGKPIDAFARVGLSAHRGNEGFRGARR